MDSRRFFQSIITQLTADDLFASSGSVMMIANKKDAPPSHQLPAAYVVPLEENAKISRFSDGSQTITVRFSILQCYQASHQQTRHTGSLGQLTHVLKARTALIPLIKKQQDDTHSAPDFIRGRLVQFGKGVLWWEDQFVTQKTIQPQP